MPSKTAPQKELDKVVQEVVSRSNARLQDAAKSLIDTLVEIGDPELFVALVGETLIHQLALKRIQEACASTETGACAAAVGTGHRRTVNHIDSARPGASNPAKAGGEGHPTSGFRERSASPKSNLKTDIYVRDHFRNKTNDSQNRPAVSADIKGLVAMRGAKALLASVKCGMIPLYDMLADDALNWAARQREASTAVIMKSQAIIDRHTEIIKYDIKLAEHFAVNLPPNMTVGEFYENNPNEYRKRCEIMVGDTIDA